MHQTGFELLLPSGVLDYFEVTTINHSAESIDIYLKEKNIKPEEHQHKQLESKGFYEESKIQDFPLRGKPVYLIVKRRRWIDKNSGDIVIRDWDLVAKGTRMTQEFASFLKELSRYRTR